MSDSHLKISFAKELTVFISLARPKRCYLDKKLLVYGKMRRDYMNTIRRYMFDDINVAIHGLANYLAALGLSIYTENLGGLYWGDLQTSLRTHYISFIKDYFPQCYTQVDSQLQASDKGNLYEIVRCGLVYEYFMKTESTVTIGGTSQASCGITYDPSRRPSLVFVVDKYFEDFKKAFNNYYDALLGTNVGLQSKLASRSF